MITIKDVARASGFSVSTVSRALADSGLIPEKSKNKIKEVAASLGYVPNLSAKNLKLKTSYNLGVINFIEGKLGYSHNLFSKVLNGFIKEAGKVGYDVSIISNYVLEKGEDLVAYCKSRNIVGVFILAGDFSKPEMKRLQESDIPTVVVDGYESGTLDNSYYVSSNNREVMRKLVSSVIEKGHRNIVYVHGSDIYVTKERVAGFKDAVSDAGITFSDDMLIEGSYYDMAAVPAVLEEILKRKPLPTCIFLPDDYCALKVCAELYKKGFKIPDDISVVGFDGLEYVKHIYPTVTTAVQDVDAMGKKCAKILTAAIKGESLPHNTFIDAKIFSGESVKSLNNKR